MHINVPEINLWAKNMFYVQKFQINEPPVLFPLHLSLLVSQPVHLFKFLANTLSVPVVITGEQVDRLPDQDSLMVGIWFVLVYSHLTVATDLINQQHGAPH